MTEDCLLTGSPEPTNESYAIAKIAGLKMCQAYLHGPGDNFDLQKSDVLPALIRKFHEAREANVDTWRSGARAHPRRHFLHVNDLTDACLYLIQA